jgi:threonine dehydratase
MSLLPTSADVRDAALRLRDVAVWTPLLRCEALDALTGGRIFIKPEVLQRTGSFKFRGAYNRLAQLTPDECRGGVVAWSSGNHAQGVAAAAALLGIKARIVMPADAPRMKTERTRAMGAEIVTYDRLRDDREAIGHALAAEHGARIVPPYDDPIIIAGQGTVGLEIAKDAARLGIKLDAMLAPASGGGLIAGISLALSEASPATEIFSVEPAGFDDHLRSLIAGTRLGNDQADGSICDALMAAMPGAMTFEINRHRLAGGCSFTDA